jgi:hypothetical protein
MGRSTAIGVAEHDPIRAALLRRLQALQGVFRVGTKTVEEMLRVKNHLIDMFLYIGNGIRDNFQISFFADAEIIADVKIPCFAYQRRDRGVGIQKNFQTYIL